MRKINVRRSSPLYVTYNGNTTRWTVYGNKTLMNRARVRALKKTMPSYAGQMQEGVYRAEVRVSLRNNRIDSTLTPQ